MLAVIRALALSNTAIFILLFLVVALLLLIVRFVGNLVMDKADDAISNARKRRQQKSAPQKTENLADRYKK